MPVLFPTKKIIKESCCENHNEVLHAHAYQADQIELCSRLDLDGLTPTLDQYKEASLLNLPIKCMIRNREGNFVYSEDDIGIMLSSIRKFKGLGVDGFVLGALDQEKCLDMETIKTLCKEAYPIPVTIHKCIDLVDDKAEAITQLKTVANVHFILSSGGKPTALEGAQQLKEMIALAEPNINIIAAGKITPDNLEALHKMINGKHYHGRSIV